MSGLHEAQQQILHPLSPGVPDHIHPAPVGLGKLQQTAAGEQLNQRLVLLRLRGAGAAGLTVPRKEGGFGFSEGFLVKEIKEEEAEAVIVDAFLD